MTDTALTTATNNLPSDLNQLTVELKFYINQWGQNTIEIGKRLIAAKELVGHGNWSKWLEENFNMTQRHANNFMNCAERFGKMENVFHFQPSQLMTLLALPEEETEKFIAEQAANGNPVEDMTVKQLRAEVAEYKAELAKKNSEVEKLHEDKEGLNQTISNAKNTISNLTAEKNQLEQANAELNEVNADLNKKIDSELEHSLELQSQLENQKPTEKIVEVKPADYEPLKEERDNLQNQIAELNKKLADKTIEVQIPSDYDSNKQRLKELQAELEEYTKLAVIVQTFESISKQIDSIHFAGNLGKALAYYEKNSPNDYRRFLANVADFHNLIKE